MKAMIFLTGLALLLAGCIIRSTQPVTEKKGIGQLLDDAFKGTAKVADEVGKVDSLVARSTRNKLSPEEMGVLMGAIVKGGSEAIAKFKEIPIHKFADMEESMEVIVKRFDILLDKQPDQLQRILSLASSGKPQEAAGVIKHITDITKDKVFLGELRKLDNLFDEVAESVADNHTLAKSIGAALDKDTPFQMRFAQAEGGFDGSDVAAELMVGQREIGHVDPDLVNFVRALDEVAETDMWSEILHIELMLRHADDGKPIYTKITQVELEQMGVPFDKNFTEPLVTRCF